MERDAYFNQLEWCTKSDHALFAEIERGMPAEPPGHGGGLMAHSLNSLRMASAIIQPTSILEIGFNIGRSAAMWMHLTDAALVGVDIRDAQVIRDAGAVLRDRYPQRFELIITDRETRDEQIVGLGRVFDLVFIDGGHEYNDVMTDIRLAERLGVKKLLFDDWHPHTGPGVQRAIFDSRLKVHAIFGNLAYCERIVIGEDW